MRQGYRLIALVTLAALFALVPALGAAWTIDGVHSFATFTIRHLMISTVHGEFGKISGTVEYDGKDIAGIKVDATIDAASITTHVSKRDEHLRSPDFFDVPKYPTITFSSKKATPAGAGRLTLTGDLTMHGVTKEVTLDVEGLSEVIKDPYGNSRIGAHATTKLNRKEFGISWDVKMDTGGLVAGEEVTVTIDLELVQKASPGKAAAPAPAEKPAEGKAPAPAPAETPAEGKAAGQ